MLTQANAIPTPPPQPMTLGDLTSVHLGSKVLLVGVQHGYGLLEKVQHEQGQGRAECWVSLVHPEERGWRYFAKHPATTEVIFLP